jgi:threonine dehydratase
MPVTFEDISDAHDRIRSAVHRTPVLTSNTFNRIFGCEAYFKAENFQRAGAFKFRGAFNSLSQLDDDQRRRGVLTYSSGNHAGALALAGSILSVPVTVVMPNDAPTIKKAATEGYGGEVVLYDRDETSREELGARLASERGLTVIPPYDYRDVIAGQGTAAKELIEDIGPLDLLLVPCGGGGLLGGSSVASKAMQPDCRVIGVEPRAGDDACRSFRSGKIETVYNPDTIADGARTPSVGALTFELMRSNADDMLSVEDGSLIDGCRFYWERMKIIVEPTGALSVAPIWDGQVDVSGQRVGIIISGGNADVSAVASMMAARPTHPRL